MLGILKFHYNKDIFEDNIETSLWRIIEEDLLSKKQ